MKTIIFFIVSFIIMLSRSCLALDLDDGIAIDDSIAEYHELGKIQKNISFVIRNVLSSASRATAAATADTADTADMDNNSSSAYATTMDNDAGEESENSRSSNSALSGSVSSVNSIIIGAGSNIRGDIIIIDRSQGDNTAITQ